MAATIVALADDLVDALAAETFTAPYATLEPERTYLPTHELPDLATLRVSVVPSGLVQEVDSRSESQCDYRLDIGIQKRTNGTETALDQLSLLLEEIADFVIRLRLLSGEAKCVKVDVPTVYDPSHLQEANVFTAVVQSTFRMLREV